MLRTPLLHPTILHALGRAGHGSRVLIADANFPHGTARGPHAELVHLNLTPGCLTATQILDALLTAVPVEGAAVMRPATEGPNALSEEPPIFEEFRAALAGTDAGGTLKPLERSDFYDACRSPDVALTVASGDQRIYANVLLTLGVVRPE